MGVKQPGREVEHSPPSAAEVKKGIVILSLLLTSSLFTVYNFTFYVLTRLYCMSILIEGGVGGGISVA